jgi:hypothetical protein
MSRLGEEIVEEWLNRQGYFTIRGIKLGVDEIDILAIRPLPNGKIDGRHIEVQVSVRPISYICELPKHIRRETGRAAKGAAERSPKELKEGVKEWVDKKYHKRNKLTLLASLGQDEWKEELVVHNVKSEHELELIRGHGIHILRLSQILKELRDGNTLIKAASGSDLLELMHLSS